MRRAIKGLAPVLVACVLSGQAGWAQVPTHPFVFSLLPTPEAGATRLTIFGDLAYGEHMFAAVGPEHLEQRLGAELGLGSRVTLVAQGGWTGSSAASRSRLSGEAEVFGGLTRPTSHFQLAVGLGGERDYQGTAAAVGRVVVGARWARNMVVSNVRLERPFGAPERDALDVSTTLGFAHEISPSIRLGVEAVAEDLEGFVESDEAEGGAKLMVGPSVAWGSPESAWGISVIGGPVLHVSRSTVSGAASGASRDLSNGFVLRTSLIFRP